MLVGVDGLYLESLLCVELLDGLKLVLVSWEALGVYASFIEDLLIRQRVGGRAANALLVLADLNEIGRNKGLGDHSLIIRELCETLELEHDGQWNPSGVVLLDGLLKELVASEVAVGEVELQRPESQSQNNKPPSGARSNHTYINLLDDGGGGIGSTHFLMAFDGVD